MISPKDNLVSFRYDQGSRSKKVLDDILEGYTGAIQSDGYAVYKDVGRGVNRRKVRRIACLAHIRRKFIESITTDPRAKEGLDFITQLYTITRRYIYYISMLMYPSERRRFALKLRNNT